MAFRLFIVLSFFAVSTWSMTCLSTTDINAYAPRTSITGKLTDFAAMDLVEVHKYLQLYRNLPFFATERCAGKTLDDASYARLKTNQASLVKLVVRWENSEAILYDDALEKSTLALYDRYLRVYPAGKHVAVIRKLRSPLLAGVEQERIIQLKHSPSLAEFRKYLDDFPSGSYAGEARKALRNGKKFAADSAKFAAVVARENVTALVKFRKENPRNPFLDRLEEAAWQIVKSDPTLKKIRSYQKGWPAGVHVPEARKIKEKLRQKKERIDSKDYSALRKNRSVDKCRTFFSDHPGSYYFADAEEFCSKVEIKAERRLLASLKRKKSLAACAEFREKFPAGLLISEVENLCATLQKKLWKKKSATVVRNPTAETCHTYNQEVEEKNRTPEARTACRVLQEDIDRIARKEQEKQKRVDRLVKQLCKERVRIHHDLPKLVEKARVEGNENYAEQLAMDLEDLVSNHEFSTKDYRNLTNSNWVFSVSECAEKYGVKSRW